jgi:hypothetical protein
VPRSFFEKSVLPMGLSQELVEVPILAAGPNTPLGDPKQDGLSVWQVFGDPPGSISKSSVVCPVFKSVARIHGQRSFTLLKPLLAFFFCISPHLKILSVVLA